MTALRDRIALVTGASSGIGAAIARSLAEAGARVALCGRDGDRLQAVAEELRGLSPEVDVHRVELQDDTQVRRMASRVLSTFGGVDILVHSAAVFTFGAVAEAPLDDLDLSYRLNLRAPYLLTQLLLPSLRTRQGQVVFLNSHAGLKGHRQASAYAATKAALRALADTLREEVNADGVRVLSVYPGSTATPMQIEVRQHAGKPYVPEALVQPEDVAGLILSALALPRTAEVTELYLRPLQPS